MSSQAKQDEFVLSFIDKGTFLDVGCYLPDQFNNSHQLEQNGWTGIAVDIKDYSKEWEIRTTPFIQADALECDWGYILPPFVIDYLSLDIDGPGDRFKALERIVTVREFKIITVEHDRYLKDHLQLEAEPQRELLNRLGYQLVCKDVRADTRPFEDWWVNPKYITTNLYCDGLYCGDIIHRLK